MQTEIKCQISVSVFIQHFEKTAGKLELYLEKNPWMKFLSDEETTSNNPKYFNTQVYVTHTYCYSSWKKN